MSYPQYKHVSHPLAALVKKQLPNAEARVDRLFRRNMQDGYLLDVDATHGVVQIIKK